MDGPGWVISEMRTERKNLQIMNEYVRDRVARHLKHV